MSEQPESTSTTNVDADQVVVNTGEGDVREPEPTEPTEPTEGDQTGDDAGESDSE